MTKKGHRADEILVTEHCSWKIIFTYTSTGIHHIVWVSSDGWCQEKLDNSKVSYMHCHDHGIVVWCKHQFGSRVD